MSINKYAAEQKVLNHFNKSAQLRKIARQKRIHKIKTAGILDRLKGFFSGRDPQAEAKDQKREEKLKRMFETGQAVDVSSRESVRRLRERRLDNLRRKLHPPSKPPPPPGFKGLTSEEEELLTPTTSRPPTGPVTILGAPPPRPLPPKPPTPPPGVTPWRPPSASTNQTDEDRAYEARIDRQNKEFNDMWNEKRKAQGLPTLPSNSERTNKTQVILPPEEPSGLFGRGPRKPFSRPTNIPTDIPTTNIPTKEEIMGRLITPDSSSAENEILAPEDDPMRGLTPEQLKAFYESRGGRKAHRKNRLTKLAKLLG